MAPGRRPPLGRCLYCLAAGVRLTEEHLIPRSLGGTRTLRDAVCEPCRVYTNRFEQATLDREFVVPKTLLALKRRRARQPGPRRLPPLALSTDADIDAQDAPVDLDAARYPRSFTLPTFAPAGLLAGVDRGRVATGVREVACRLQLGTPRGEASVRPKRLADPVAYACTIAKWAYGLAVFECGLAGCDTRAIRALLLGERDDVFNVVGGSASAAPREPAWLHSVTMHEDTGWRVARLNVLGSAGMSPYEVVIGALATSSA